MEIVQVGAPVLRQAGRLIDPAELRSKEFKRLVEQMRETMIDAPGVGLAAPQIGLSLQLAVLEDPPEFVEAQSTEQRALTERDSLPFTVMINPVVTPVGNHTVEFFEGCLSVDGYRALVSRFHTVHARWIDMKGNECEQEFTGWPARIVQHEVDHLRGIVYVDRMLPRSFMTTEAWAEHWGSVPIDEIHEALAVDAPTPPHP